MPIYKRCSKCNKRILHSEQCKCNSKRYREYKTTDLNKFYFTKEWKQVKKTTKEFYYGLDIYSLYTYGIIEYGYTVHHIEPLENAYEKRLCQDNLIYLTESNHRIIHKLLEVEYHKTVKLLKDMRKRFEKEYRG